MPISASTASGHRGAVTVRTVSAADADGLRAFYGGLSAQSRRLRFLGYVSAVGASNARSFCTPDHEHEEGFVAVDDPQGRILGHICLVPDGEGGTELAIAVEDASQCQGIGGRLFQAALRWGEEHHLDRFTATAFADNAGMLRLAASGPYPATSRPRGPGVVDIEIPLQPRPRGLRASIARRLLAGSTPGRQ